MEREEVYKKGIVGRKRRRTNEREEIARGRGVEKYRQVNPTLSFWLRSQSMSSNNQILHFL